MRHWDGEWWADTLEGEEAAAYEELVRQLLLVSQPADIPGVARQIFQLGHEHGYALARDLSAED